MFHQDVIVSLAIFCCVKIVMIDIRFFAIGRRKNDEKDTIYNVSFPGNPDPDRL